jgi:alpha-L-fucosidase
LPYPWQGALTFGSWFYKADGQWINANSGAIYSRPRKIYGDNLYGDKSQKNISEADLEANKKQQSENFNERNIASPAYPHNEVRFTTK